MRTAWHHRYGCPLQMCLCPRVCFYILSIILSIPLSPPPTLPTPSHLSSTSGDVELKVQITGFQFQGSPAQNPWQVIESSTSLERILEIVSGDVTFTGCGRCAVELDTDENGIYRPCYPCLPHTSVRHYYRSDSKKQKQNLNFFYTHKEFGCVIVTIAVQTMDNMQ